MNPTGATSAARFLPVSADVSTTGGLGPLRHVAVTGSTNLDLVTEARAGDVSAAVLVADHQTEGRGRLQRTWEDAAGGSLLLSVRIPTDPSAAAGVVQALGAAARAATDAVCDVAVLAKWPNDLVVRDGPAPGKLAGVLAEFVTGDQPCLVIGIGINLRPIGRQAGATSLAECGGTVSRDAVLAAVLRGFASRRADGSGVLDELRQHSATLGSRVRVELPGEKELIGQAVDLAPGGELRVRTDDGHEHTVGTGDVVHLRPA